MWRGLLWLHPVPHLHQVCCNHDLVRPDCVIIAKDRHLRCPPPLARAVLRLQRVLQMAFPKFVTLLIALVCT